MKALDLIGSISTAYLRQSLTKDESDGTARFLLDRLTGPQIAAICHTILATPTLPDQIQLRIPRALGEPQGLPSDILTDERTTYWRHAVCDRPVLLIANTDDDQGQSLRELTPIGSLELLAATHLWVDQAADGLGLPEPHLQIWEKALRGLQRARPLSLDMFAIYVLTTQSAIVDRGAPLLNALGWALPTLRVPRDTAFFEAIPERARTHTDRWQRLYHQAFNKRAPYLLKLTPNQQPILPEQLQQRMAEAIDDALHATVSAFIAAPSSWTPEVEAFSYLEWERDNVKALFDGIKTRRQSLGQATIDFYDDEFPDSLTEEEQEYLRHLDKSKARQAQEEDEAFYERHRTELARQRLLKTQWDKFIFGQPIQTDDFMVGLLRCLERLFEQADLRDDTRQLKIEVQRLDLRHLNHKALAYFALRYRGLYRLTERLVDWQIGKLFDFEAWVESEKKRGRYQKHLTAAKAANQLKFYVRLTCGAEQYSVHMTWHFNPHGIYSSLAVDWQRLAKYPLLRTRVSREPVSQKGKLQSVDLADISTLMPVFHHDRGSLVPASHTQHDLHRELMSALDEALQTQRISLTGHTALQTAWAHFAEQYARAVQEFSSEGVASPACLSLESAYIQLLTSLSEHAPGDANRQRLWQPILELGITHVDGGPPAAIVPPWHPLRLLGMVVKVRQFCDLIRHLVHAPTVNFGDVRVFFSDLTDELSHSYYPEVCLGIKGAQPILLSCSTTYADYTLMESPVVSATGDDVTNDNPAKSANDIVALVRDYIQLLPHERTNLSILLYNCHSAQLPQAAVKALGNLYEEDNREVRCQVFLQHRDTVRLSQLYETLLERDSGEDDVIASETSQDFMARLRIHMLTNGTAMPLEQDDPPVDLVFLQDVIARHAEQVWLDEAETGPIPELLHHSPPRGSRRRPATRDDMRSVVYLTAPSQPEVGWHYLQALRSIIEGNELVPKSRPVPARQISFQDNTTRRIFEDVHRLGQWVVNADDLLTRRQLRSQNVHVIRHRQQRNDARSLTISSKAPMNLLSVMVQQRLRNLNLDLEPIELVNLTDRIVRDASEISGGIVLRAAKRGQFASELIGLVLSRFLLQNELSQNDHCGWYFLDDYATWLGQREGHIADILALSPQRHYDQTVLVILVSEAKYIANSALANSRRTSAVQLRETVHRLQDALFGDPGRLDRDFWLSRLADMILDGIEVPATEGHALYSWRDAIRCGAVSILLKGYSHVFVHRQQPDEGDPSIRCALTNAHQAWQEIYGRDQLRQLMLAYHQGSDPKKVRASLGDDKPWDARELFPPTPSVLWSTSAEMAPICDDEVNERVSSDLEQSPSPPTDADQDPNEVAIHVDRPDDADIELRHSDKALAFDWTASHLRQTLTSLAQTSCEPSEDVEWLEDSVKRLRTALFSYNLQAKIVDYRLTPNTALIRLQGSDKLRIGDIENRRTELLTTHGLQITNLLAEPGLIVIAVARPQRQIVSLLNVWRSRTIDHADVRSNQKLILGVRESDGETLCLHPGELHAPHTLIAGTTGSGKSVLLQNLLLDIAATNNCASAQIILIDPKQGADYIDLQDLPHLQSGIIISQDAAQEALESCVAEMDRRYTLFREVRVANLSRYNTQVPAEQRLPVIWLIHDEFAAWMLTDDYKEIVSNTVQRLGVMARAAGIFLIFAAQRPEERIMPMQLRDNLGNRLVLRVESPGTSAIALGEKGAERLLGKGHLAARLPSEGDLIFAQVPFLAPEEYQAIVTAIRQDS